MVQTILSLCSHGLAGGRPFRANPASAAPRRTKSRMDACLYTRRDLDARQVGVPLVRFLGSPFPLHLPCPRRSATRQAADKLDAARVVHAPQRTDPRLRVGL